MILTDVNILVYAFRKDADNHARYRKWLSDIINAPGPYSTHDLVLSGFLRVVTHPKVFKQPSSFDEAFGFVDTLRSQPNCHALNCGEQHWDIFIDLCRKADARGNLIADAFLAALAIQSGCEWVTADRDFARFQGLRWFHPLG